MTIEQIQKLIVNTVKVQVDGVPIKLIYTPPRGLTHFACLADINLQNSDSLIEGQPKTARYTFH